MPEPEPPGHDDHWTVKLVYQIRLLVKELAPLAAVAAAMWAGCQADKNGTKIDSAKTEVVAKVDTTAAKVDDAATKAEEVKTTLKAETAKTQQKLGSIEAEVKRGK